MKTVVPVVAGLLLAGCAHGGGPQVTVQGQTPAAGRSFAMTDEAGAAPAQSQVQNQAQNQAAAEVARALAAAGLRAAPAAEADYLVSVAYADRPSRVGVYAPAADRGAEPDWLARGQAAPRAWIRKGATVLVVRIEDRASGRLLRRADASGFYWRDGSKAPARLAQAATARLVQP